MTAATTLIIANWIKGRRLTRQRLDVADIFNFACSFTTSFKNDTVPLRDVTYVTIRYVYFGGYRVSLAKGSRSAIKIPPTSDDHLCDRTLNKRIECSFEIHIYILYFIYQEREHVIVLKLIGEYNERKS